MVGAVVIQAFGATESRSNSLNTYVRGARQHFRRVVARRKAKLDYSRAAASRDGAAASTSLPGQRG
jgi:hypothetical protein